MFSATPCKNDVRIRVGISLSTLPACAHCGCKKSATLFWILCWNFHSSTCFWNSPFSVHRDGNDCLFFPVPHIYNLFYVHVQYSGFFTLKESTLGATAQYLFEGLSELFVEDGVYDGVEARVAVTNPEEKLKERIGDDTGLRAHGLQGVGEEEWEPAHHKDPDDHRQHKGEPFLSVHHGFTPRCSRVVVCFWLPPWHQSRPLWSGNHVPVALDRGRGVDAPSSRGTWHVGAASTSSVAVLHVTICAWAVAIVIVSFFPSPQSALLLLLFSLGRGRLGHRGWGWGAMGRGIKGGCDRGHGCRRGRRLQEIIGCGILGGWRLCLGWGRGKGKGGGSGIGGFVVWRGGAFFIIFPIGLCMALRMTWRGTAGAILPGLSWWASGSLLGYLVDSYVDQDHDDARCKEGANGGVKDVPAFIVQLALGASVGLPLPWLALVQWEQGGEGDDGGDEPNHHNRGFDASGSPLTPIRDPGDGEVAVQGDGAQVHNRGGAEEHVQRQVDLTPQRLKVPVAEKFISQGEGDDERGH